MKKKRTFTTPMKIRVGRYDDCRGQVRPGANHCSREKGTIMEVGKSTKYIVVGLVVALTATLFPSAASASDHEVGVAAARVQPLVTDLAFAAPENPRQADAETDRRARISRIISNSQLVQSMPVSQVKSLQSLLNEVTSAGLVVDGDYGILTAEAVYDLQVKANLTRDYVAGPEVFGALAERSDTPRYTTPRQADLATSVCAMQQPDEWVEAIAVRVDGNYNARAYPALSCDLGFNITNSVVTYLGRTADWRYVRDSEGRYAWIAASAFEEPVHHRWGDDGATESIATIAGVVLQADNGDIISFNGPEVVADVFGESFDSFEKWGEDDVFRYRDKVVLKPTHRLPNIEKGVQRALLGPGDDVATRLKVAKVGGKALSFVGFILVAHDSWDRYSDETTEARLALSASRTLFITAAGTAAALLGGVCGPAAPVCAVPFAVAGGLVGEYVWDNSEKVFKVADVGIISITNPLLLPVFN